MSALGILFGLLVLTETLTSPEGAIGTAFTVTSWPVRQWVLVMVDKTRRRCAARATPDNLYRSD